MKPIFILFFFIFSQASYALDIVVVGLFKNKAIVKIDGKQRTLKKGITTPEGVTLTFSDSSVVTLKINGIEEDYKLGRQVGGEFKRKELAEARILPVNGMYNTSGFINGQLVGFLVDTGATWIAMSSNQARSLGLNYKKTSTKSHVSTANGIVLAYKITLDKVRVGDIELRNVVAAVLEGNSPREVLLGNSFLNRLEMQRQGQVMVLRKKF
ncbi:MAG: TIGR02281 family clan AA aspartic protease [Woeseiaceae bacterium]